MIELDEDYRRIDVLMDRYPQLSNEEIKTLARQSRTGDAAARELLILHNLRLPVAVAKPYTNAQTFGDGVQEAIEGLIKAVDRYDPDLGYNFSTYAMWWIKQAIRLWMYRKNRIYAPRYMHDAMIRVKMFSEDCERDAAEIARRAEMPLDRVIMAQSILSMKYVSMDMQVVGLDGPATLAEMLCDESDIYAEIEEHDGAKSIVQEYLSLLTTKEQQIVRWRYGLDGEELSVADISIALKVSKQRIQQILSRAMERLQASALTIEVAS